MTKLKVLPNDSGGQSPGSYYRTSEAVVNPQDKADVEKWAKNLGIAPKDLMSAIEKYGVVVSNIRKGLLKEKVA